MYVYTYVCMLHITYACIHVCVCVCILCIYYCIDDARHFFRLLLNNMDIE